MFVRRASPVALLAVAWLFCLIGSLAPVRAVQAQDLVTIPALTAHVMDQTGTLNASQKQALDAKLTAFEAGRGTQIVVLMVASTLPEDIADYTQRVGDSWKIGRKGLGDGLLLVVAKNDRKVRIATAKALEGAIPDLAARQIIDQALTPRFKQGDFAGGLDAAVDQLMARISGENLPLPETPASSSGDEGFQWADMAVFLFFAVPIGARLLSGVLGRKGGAFTTGGVVGVLAWIFTSSVLLALGAGIVGMVFGLIASLGSLGGVGRRSSGWGSGGGTGWSSGGGGFSSGSGDSGGFSSGGGGDFGGGGASGDW
ncbi:MAG: TPM domain-containing protein [Pseudomonadota bacterium]